MNVRLPILDNTSGTVNAVAQALVHLGRDNIDADLIRSFASRIDDRDMRALAQSRPKMSGWMGDVILQIDAARND